MKREYPEAPIVGVGGVIFQDSTVLLVKRGQEPGKGQWSLPGGVMELGETLTEALKREILEEVSIGIEIGGLVKVLDPVDAFPRLTDNFSSGYVFVHKNSGCRPIKHGLPVRQLHE